MKRLFLLEDDLSLISGLSFAVKKQGYEIDAARTMLEADALWGDGKYDLAVLDVSLPDGSGFDFCKKIRQTSKVPVMFLTAADEETDMIMGLDIGGDDYITKPFKLAVFLSRLHALLRRSENFNTDVTELKSNDIRIKLLKGEVYKQGKLLVLTASEYKLLCLFMEHPGQILSPDQILGKLWDCSENYVDNSSLTVSDISHQLKTPLAALNIYNGLIQDEAKELPAIQEFGRLSEQELDRIETLVQNLLKITKLDAGTIVLEKSFENVSELAEDVKRHFLFGAGQEGKEIRLSGKEDISLLCDRDWIIEAVSNLVKNALDHTEKGGVICIQWRAFPSIVQITVKDNGSGIRPEDLHHIFKRFYRSRFSKDTQGIGLGLPLAKSIIEAHQGSIEVYSELGHGTTFTINFPIMTK